MALIGGVIRNAANHYAIWGASAMPTGGSFSNLVSADGNGIWNALWGYEGISVTHSASGYNPAAVNYVQSDIAWFADYQSYGYWKVVELTAAPQQPTSCFTGPTKVLMADGDERAIADVGIGDRVAGMNGTINIVVAVEKPLLGTRRLYSFNGSDPFVTAEHPFMTDRGWCSVDPAALRAEGCLLDVSALRTGARLLCVASVGVLTSSAGAHLDVSFEHEALRSLETVEADPATQLHNLLLDGDHSYVADGFVVHNKPSSH